MPSFNDAKEEVSYWEAQFKLCDSMRRSYEEQWYYNLAFYFSKQWVIWQRQTSGQARLVDPPTPRNRVRLTSNRIKPAIRRELTKLIKEEPIFYVLPNTTSMEDIAASKVAEAIADSILHETYFSNIRRQATFWTLITGTGFIKTTCPANNADLVYERPTPFHLFFPELEEEDLQKQPYIIQAGGMSKDVLKERFDVTLPADMQSNGRTLETKFLNALGIKNREGETQADLVYTKEIWVKPCSRYPEGAELIIAGGKLIYRYSPNGPKLDENGFPVGQGEDIFPYEHGKYPYSKMVHTPTGRFYGESTIVDLIPLQKEYNRVRSQLIEYKNRMAKPQMTYTKGSIDVSKITSEPGLYIPVQPGFPPPTPVQLRELPAYVMQEPDRIKADMDEVANQSEISRGTVPTGIEAASAIAYLKEENDSQIYYTVASIEDCMQSVGEQTLELVEQFWDIDKITSKVSRNSSFEVTVYKISSLKGNTAFRVESGSMAPKSMAAKQAFITDLMKEGLIPPDKGLRYLQMNETNRLYEELQVDSRQAQRENYKMANGQQVQVNAWDENEVHIYEHKLYMKSEEFESSDPQIQQLFMEHLLIHQEKVMPLNVGNAEPGNATGNSNSAVPAINANGQLQPTS